jgi:uncharacterized protein (TIGR03437 family)
VSDARPAGWLMLPLLLALPAFEDPGALAVEPAALAFSFVQGGPTQKSQLTVVHNTGAQAVTIVTGAGMVMVVQPDGSRQAADADHPASAGDRISIFCAGLGDVDRSFAAGVAAPDTPPMRTRNPVAVTILDRQAQVTFAGLAPSLAGIYQVDAIVPSNLAPAADVSPIVIAAGRASDPVTMPVQ